MRHLLTVLLSFISVFMPVYAGPSSTPPFSLSSPAFADQGALPSLYTCDGQGNSPELTWENSPAHTRSFVFVLSDPDAPDQTFYHWVLYNIPASFHALPQAIKHFPAGTVVGKNSAGTLQYMAPCPPKGSSHTYLFTVYALDSTLELAPGAEASTVIKSMEGHTLAKAEISAIYGRWLK